MKAIPSWLALALVGSSAACLDPSADPGSDQPLGEVDGELVPAGWPSFEQPCALDPADARRLVLTTTDFATGAVTEVDLATGTVRPDVAVGSTDAIPLAHDGDVVLLHRHRIDRIDVLDGATWQLRTQRAVTGDDGSSNPHGLAFGPDGLAYVTTFAEPTLRVLDLTAPPDQAERGRIDLAPFADDDGNPEASLAVACGDAVLVTLERLDPSFAPVGTDWLVVIDAASGEALDLEPATTAAEGLPLLGTWVRQLRRDPADASGRTLLGLSEGIERLDLSTGIRRWAVPPERFAEAGIDGRFQPQSFDLTDDGTRAYVAAYDRDFGQVRLYQVGLDDREPAVPHPFAQGFDSVERTLEVWGDQLWYGSTRQDAPGLWRFDLAAEPPAVLDGPLPTGLPPYSMVAIP